MANQVVDLCLVFAFSRFSFEGDALEGKTAPQKVWHGSGASYYDDCRAF
jgi:hypothetical protein